MTNVESDNLLNLQSFLNGKNQFQLGNLTTEKPNPKTKNLSHLANYDLKAAINILQEIDLDALYVLQKMSGKFEELKEDIQSTLKKNGRVYICGCGATGRLALSLETLWREEYSNDKNIDHVVSLMAGGDIAMIRSIEGFEDLEEFGARHLSDLNFSANDLLISSTEGGETPYVIGATNYAAKISNKSPWFIYCNPDKDLKNISRSMNVINNTKVKSLSLEIGSMALSGSTRMQATTVMMFGIGSALFELGNCEKLIEKLVSFYKNLDLTWLEDFVIAEANTYKQKEYILYSTEQYAMTVLTDTTERSPTFNLTPFENASNTSDKLSLCYLLLPHTKTPQEAWNHLLARTPRALKWEKYIKSTGIDNLYGFDFSSNVKNLRNKSSKKTPHYIFDIFSKNNFLELNFKDLNKRIEISSLGVLEEHLLLKMILNIHSTLIMGRLNRYKNNIMTWVKPSNRKLIDRAIRYITLLLNESQSSTLSYDQLAKYCFEAMNDISASDSIVLKTLEKINNT